MGKIYYHVRFDKILPGGCADVNKSGSEWDFRSLKSALSMIEDRFGNDAACWRVEDLTDRVPNLQALKPVLEDALLSCYQNVIMTFKDDATPSLKYDHYKFFIAARDDEERPPLLPFADDITADGSNTASTDEGSPDDVKAVKRMHDQILASAYEAPFFKELVNEIQNSSSGDPQAIFDLLGGMLGTAIWHLAKQEPFDDWKRQAEVSLMCLGGIGFDLDEFYRKTREECKKQIDAFFFVDSSVNLGCDIEPVAEQLNKMLAP